MNTLKEAKMAMRFSREQRGLRELVHTCQDTLAEKDLHSRMKIVNKAGFLSPVEANVKKSFDAKFDELNKYMGFEYRKFEGKNKPVSMPPIEDQVQFENDKNNPIFKALQEKKEVMLHRVDMGSYMEQQRTDKVKDTYDFLQTTYGCKDAKGVWFMHQFNHGSAHEYERVTKDVIKEYKSGIIDPTRIAAKVETRRAGKGQSKTMR